MKIHINQLELKTIIGVYEWERQCPMSIYANVSVAIDLDEINDNLASTINYFSLSQTLIKRAKVCDYKLLEALLIDLRNEVIAFDSRIKSVSLSLIKRGILQEAQSTSVETVWHRDG